MTFIFTLFVYEIQSELSHTLACPPLLKCRGVGYMYVKTNKILLFSRIDLIVHIKSLEIPTW
jgi:hypothetical protein